MNATALLILALLVAVPSCAVSRLSGMVEWRVLVGVSVFLSVVAFFLYRSDKRRAEAGAWRIPESTLHLIALIGGWPGAFLAQQTFRHKTAKTSFQIVFWIIVLAYQFLAVDSLIGWRLSRDAWHWIKAQTG